MLDLAGDASSSSPTTRERVAAAPHAHTTTFAPLTAAQRPSSRHRAGHPPALSG